MWGGKDGKGKDKSKGKGKASPEGGQGHTLPRTRISAEKFTGTVLTWKGKYGWIQPSEEIQHEKAAERGGRLFCAIDDIIGATTLDVGAEVEFHLFEDESGLGAEEIVQTGEGTGTDAGKGAGKAAKGFVGKKGDWGAKGKSAPAWNGGKANGKGWGSPADTFAAVKGYAANKGWGFDKGASNGKGKGKGKGAKNGHLLPRTRISAEKFTGTVSAWKGKYGWITPSEPVEHEKAKLRNGSLYTTVNDLQGVEELEPEAIVEFHIAEDSSGLCAEEVVVL